MKNKITLTQFLTAAQKKMGSVLWLIIFLLPLYEAFSQNTWTPKANFGGGARGYAVGFSIGSKGYIGTGQGGGGYYKDFWEWDQATDVWTQQANFGGGGRFGATGFSIGKKGYIGTGYDGVAHNDFWEWDQATNIWTQKANVGGLAREGAVGFSIGNKGYIGTGSSYVGTLLDLWEWDQTTDVWTQKANFAGGAYGVGFSIGNKGYIGTGSNYNSGIMNEFWEWDQASDTWTQKANFAGGARLFATGFSIGNKGYIGTGEYQAAFFKDFWEWDQASNTWTQKAFFGGGTLIWGVGFSIGCYGYIGTGGPDKVWWGNGSFWEYTPDSSACDTTTGCVATAVISSDPSSTVCVGQQVFISASGGTTYSWNTGATTANIVAAPSVTTTYSVMVTDAAGCTGIGTLTVPVDLGCTATGIVQLNTNELHADIWPNPSDGMFNVLPIAIGTSTINHQPLTVEVYNVFGEKVYSAEVIPITHEPLTINLSFQPSGVYFLKLKTGGAILNEKIIIRK
ncbi:MAG: T9SS type A sorting domain-containing protein [Bacteroidetes bacterium]|nr:MAG: T9SS type A sorting domain-containing protein [Bacteroidota bacterium]